MDYLAETERLLAIWSSTPLNSSHGVSQKELHELQERTGYLLPEAWRYWLSVCGRHPLVLGSESAGDGFVRFEYIERSFSPDRPSVCAIACEAQGNWSWGIRLEDLVAPDPDIWMDGEAALWLREFDDVDAREEDGLVETLCPVSHFLVGFLVRTIPFEAYSQFDKSRHQRDASSLKPDIIFHQFDDAALSNELIVRFDLKVALEEPAAWGWVPFINDAMDIIMVRGWGIASTKRELDLRLRH